MIPRIITLDDVRFTVTSWLTASGGVRVQGALKDAKFVNVFRYFKLQEWQTDEQGCRLKVVEEVRHKLRSRIDELKKYTAPKIENP